MIFQVEIVIGTIQIILVVFLIITIIFLSLFIREFIKTKHKMFGYLTVFFSTFFLQTLFQTGELTFQTEPLLILSYVSQEVFHMLVLYSIVVVLEVYERDVRLSIRQIILTILIFITIGGMVSTPTFTIDRSQVFPVSFAQEELLLIFQVIFDLAAGISLILMLFKNYKTAWSDKQRTIIIWLFLGVFFSIILPLIGYILILILTEISMDLVSFFLLFFLITMNSGAIIIGVAFLRVKKEPWLLQRQKVHLIVVYSRDGIQIYSKIFNKALSESKTALLTSSFSAITSLFQEATETAGAVKSVLLEDKELRIINKEYFVCAILEDYSTQASESAHENFTKDFEISFKDKLEQFDGEVSAFEAADQIATKYFS